MSRRRRSGPEAISYTELSEWQRLTATPATTEEIDLLMLMDDAFLVAVGTEQDEQRARIKDQTENRRR